MQSLATVPRRYEYLELVATPQLLAIQGFETGCAGEGEGCKYENYEVEADDVRVLVSGSGVRCIAGFGPRSCGQRSYCQSLAPTVATQTKIGVRVCPKSGREETLIADTTAPAIAPKHVPEVALPLAAAGPWLVGLAPGWNEAAPATPPLETPVVVERNLETGSDPVREKLTPAHYFRPLSEEDEIPAIAAVQADGQAVFLSRSEGVSSRDRVDDRFSLWRVSPTEQPTVIAAPPVDREGRPTELLGRQMFLTDGRVALAELEPAPVYGPAIAVFDTQGIQLGRYADATLKGFDFNGTTVLAAATPCAESFLETWAPGEAAAPAHPAGRCPAPLISRHVTLARRGLRVTLTCPGAPPLGCSDIKLRVTAHCGSIAQIESEAELPDELPEATRISTLKLNRSARRCLAHHRHTHLKISVSTGGRPYERTFSERSVTRRLAG